MQPQQAQQNPRLSVEITGGKYMFHYVIRDRVVFLTLTDKSYPKKLAFQYLGELSSEFCQLYGSQVDTVSRPYAFIKFGAFHMHACMHASCTCMHSDRLAGITCIHANGRNQPGLRAD